MCPARSRGTSQGGSDAQPGRAASREVAPAAQESGESFELERFFPYRLSVLSNLVSRTIAQLCSERFGISIPEWRVMAVLARFTRLTQNQITERTAMDKVRVSRAVARLVARRFVERRPDKRDRRRMLLRLNRRGRGIYREIVPLARDAEAQLLSALSPAERDQIDRLLKKLENWVAAQT